MPTNDVLNTRLPPEYVRWVDEMRRREDDVPTRSEMVRRLIASEAKRRGMTGDGDAVEDASPGAAHGRRRA